MKDYDKEYWKSVGKMLGLLIIASVFCAIFSYIQRGGF